MNPQFKAAIRKIEEARGVRFFYLAEAGSRAWGYDTEDSDYDIRAGYVQLPWRRDILDGLNTFRDDFTMNDVKVDIQAMELSKFLGNIVRSDTTLIESFLSNQVYAWDELLPKLRHLIRDHYNPRAAFNVFFDLAEANLYPKRDNQFTGKSAILALRFALMAEQLSQQEDRKLFEPRLRKMYHNSAFGPLPKILSAVQWLNENRNTINVEKTKIVGEICEFVDHVSKLKRPNSHIVRDTEDAQKLFSAYTKETVLKHMERNSDNLHWMESK